MKYLKEFKGEKEVYRLLNDFGKPGREVDTYDWEVGEYIAHCLSPLIECISRMMHAATEDPALSEYANILERLYDAAHMKLEEMDSAMNKALGDIQIRKTYDDCLGGFLQQKLLEVYVKKEQATGDLPEMDRDEREKINQKGDEEVFTKADIEFAQKAFTLACMEKEEWKKKFEEAEKARLIVSRKLSYYVSEEAAGRLHIDPIAKGANLRKVKKTDKKM